MYNSYKIISIRTPTEIPRVLGICLIIKIRTLFSETLQATSWKDLANDGTLVSTCIESIPASLFCYKGGLISEGTFIFVPYSKNMHKITALLQPFPLSRLSRDFLISIKKSLDYQIWQWTRIMDAQWSLLLSKSRTFGFGQTNWADKFWGIWILGYFRPNY